MAKDPIIDLLANLQSARTRAEFNEAFGTILNEFEETVDYHSKEVQGNVACRNGCSWCCHIPVDVRAHEIFYLADHLLQTRTPAQLESLQTDLAAHWAITRDLGRIERASKNVRCPLLVNDSCSVYEARPIACRMHHSMDLNACKYSFENPTDLEFPSPRDDRLFTVLAYGSQVIGEAYTHSGFDPTTYELCSALKEALNDPECFERWARHEKAFLTAKVTA